MAHDGQDTLAPPQIILDDLTGLTAAAIPQAEALLEAATARVREMVSVEGRVSSQAMEANQTAAHGLAWLATYVESLRQMQAWAERLTARASSARSSS
jgi:(2S)-methylsuccinyl-CoA dehydrogenase